MHNWHIDAIAKALNEVQRGNIKRLVINIPPRHLKSFCISVAFPAWILGQDPSKRIVVASYSEKLALKHSLDCRNLMQNSWFHRIFPRCILSREQNEKYKFSTTKNGYRFATSVGGTLTGEGGDILIIDDPHSPQQVLSKKYRDRTIDWYRNTFSSRLNDRKNGAIIVVMQRLHRDDLTGYLMDRGKQNWFHLCLPAIFEENKVLEIGNFKKQIGVGELLFPERENTKELEQLKNDMGSYFFNAQYQQKPSVSDGGMIKNSWLKKYVGERNFKRIYLSFDTAIKAAINNDPTVCTVWGELDANYYLVDVVREWLEYPELKKLAVDLIARWKPVATLIEDKASGQMLLQDLKREMTTAGTNTPSSNTSNAINSSTNTSGVVSSSSAISHSSLISIKPLRDKISRFAGVTPLFESGRIFIRDNDSWLFDYEYELLSFPQGLHDDQVDSTSQFLNWAVERSYRFSAAGVRLRRL